MTSRADERSDRGSALIEFSVASLILLIPLVYLIIALGRLQAASYAVTSAATAASTIIARTPDDHTPAAASDAVVLALHDHGFDDAAHDLTIDCTPSCAAPDALITARVTVDVPLPGVPAAIDAAVPTHIAVTAHHADRVSAYD